MGDQQPGRPTLVLVTGPGGAGKTTLAVRLAGEIGCPLISRDAIKEGMVAATPGFVPDTSDPLTRRTYEVFFAVIRLLLEHGVTQVAEAAFQHHNWVRPLEPMRAIADLRILRCLASAQIRLDRADRRRQQVKTRAAHDDAGYFAADSPASADFEPIRLDEPTLDVDTSDDYVPDFDTILTFVRTGRPRP